MTTPFVGAVDDLPCSISARQMYSSSCRRHAVLLLESWRRWNEAEDFQAVGMQLRECVVGFAGETASDELVPDGEQRPQAANVSKWMDLVANLLAAGSSSARLRSYLKKLGEETWAYVNWFTHAGNAAFIDTEFAASAVSHLLASSTAARMRWEQAGTRSRCPVCDSYATSAEGCPKCGWFDDDHEPDLPSREPGSQHEPDLSQPCIPSSDVSTFITPDDYRQ